MLVKSRPFMASSVRFFPFIFGGLHDGPSGLVRSRLSDLLVHVAPVGLFRFRGDPVVAVEPGPQVEQLALPAAEGEVAVWRTVRQHVLSFLSTYRAPASHGADYTAMAAGLRELIPHSMRQKNPGNFQLS
jgi:hypothetical protein